MPRSKWPKPYTPLTRQEMLIYNRLWRAIDIVFEGEWKDVDQFVIVGATQALYQSAEAQIRIRENVDNEGLPIQQYENGTSQVSPDYTIARTRMMDAAKLLKDAGLTMSERMKNKINKDDGDEFDIVAELLMGTGLTEADKKNQKIVN